MIANNESVEIKQINKKIDVLDNNIRDLQKNVDYRFEKVDEKFDVLDNKIEHKFEKIDEKLEKFRTEFTSQSRWIIGLIVTLIIAVGILKFI